MTCKLQHVDAVTHGHPCRSRTRRAEQIIQPRLELQPVLEKDTCFRQRHRILGRRFIDMRVTVGADEHCHLHLVAGHLLHEVAQDAVGRYHLERPG